MGFFSNLEKKNLIGPIKIQFILKVEHSPDANLRRFIYSSVICTDSFFNNFFDKKEDLGFLVNFKQYLNPSSIREVFKLFSLSDLSSLIRFEKMRLTKEPNLPSQMVIQNLEKFENDILFSLDCTEEDKKLYKELNNANKMQAHEFTTYFYQLLLAKIFGTSLPPKMPELAEDATFNLYFRRSEIFGKLLQKP